MTGTAKAAKSPKEGKRKLFALFVLLAFFTVLCLCP
jgi:hypothetical protein